MPADADCVSGARTGDAALPATLPRSFRPSSLLRRRLADSEYHHHHHAPSVTPAGGLRLSMPLAGDSLDFLDFSAFISGVGGGAVGGGGYAQTAEESMLQALLSSLPEPPASTTTRLGKVSTVDGLANSLPAPPLAFQRKPQLAEMVGVPGSAFGRKRESSQSDTGSLAATALGTPASSRRNTDEVDLPPLHRARLQQHASVDSLISTASDSDTVSSAQAAAPEQQLLAAEMPPVSPFFARVSFADIDDARETVRRASLSRRRSSRRISQADSYDRHAASWCAPAVSTSTDTASSISGGGRLSLAEISRALADVFAPSPAVDDFPTDDLPISQQCQPTLPRALLADAAPPRWFRVDVFGLLTSQTARVTVAELGSSPHSLVDVLEPAVQRALRRYPLVLALATRQQKQSAAMPTRMRAPKKRRGSPASAASLLLSTPTLSFTVSSSSDTDSGADRPVRAVDVEAMAAAYLPHIHALLAGSDAFNPMPPAQAALGVQQPQFVPTQSSYTATPPSSEEAPGLDGGSLCSGAGSTATLADSLRSAEAPAEAQAQAQAQAKPAPRSLLRRPQRRSDTGLVAAGGSAARTPQLRASASVANLRGAYTDRAGAQQQQQQQPMMSRRRSEVQALITQANAVMSSALRRSSALDPPAALAATQTLPRQLRPPRASFPVYATPGLSSLRSPALSSLRSPGSLADAASSGLRAPTALAAALSRQQHRLEPARGGSRLLRHSISDIALPPAPAGAAANALLPASMRGARGAATTTATTPLSGIRPPPPPTAPHPPASAPPANRRAAPASAGPSRLRHAGPSSAALRQAFGEGGVRARPGVQALLAGNSGSSGSACDEGFLTLRPVHTPDLVPRTIDPRLIERAMTPMLKTNVGIQYSSLVDLVRRSSAAIARGADADAADDDDDDLDLDLDQLPALVPATATAAAAELLQQSRFSPISSPERSPPVLAPVGARLAKPGFLARYRAAKSSTAPLPVSAIPLPPRTAAAAPPPPPSRALGLSNIPTLRKARSLWAMRSTPGQK